jgi:cyanophycinase-like exopeptidase
MSYVQPVSVRSHFVDSARPPLPDRDKKIFSRAPVNEVAVVKDKAVLSSASLARELEALFPAAGIYGFFHGGEQCRVKRFPVSNNLQVISPNGWFATILNGAVVDRHGPESAIAGLLSAARGAVPN